MKKTAILSIQQLTVWSSLRIKELHECSMFVKKQRKITWDMAHVSVFSKLSITAMNEKENKCLRFTNFPPPREGFSNSQPAVQDYAVPNLNSY